MTLDEAVAAVEATLHAPGLRVDRRLAREENDSFLLLVLDTSRGRHEDPTPVANGPRLVDKRRGDVTRLTIPDALARAERMALVASSPEH
ncbi:MAG: hypothetical protein U0R80_00350 [Nocardioidaceae bacterium]